MTAFLQAWSLLVASLMLALALGSWHEIPLGRPPEIRVGRGPLTVLEARGYFDLRRATFIDARPRADYLREHVHRAGNLPAHDFEAFKGPLLELPRETLFIVYCDNPRCGAEEVTARKMAELGYTNVFTMPEGLQGWVRARLPTRAGEQP